MDNIILQKTWVQGCPVIVDNLLGTAFTGEAQAHTFVVSGVDAAQEPVTITGTITGKFLAANNVTVPLTGSLVNGAASITLTDECYDVPGRYILSIYATNGSTTQCLYCAVGNVFRTDSQTIAYPSTDLPNITTLMAQLEEILDNWPADYSEIASAVGITPEKYGAVGDGSTDDVSAMRQAITAAETADVPLLMGSGKTYALSGEIDISKRIQIFGNGATLKAISGNTGNMIYIEADQAQFPTTLGKALIENLTIDCNGVANCGIFIRTIGGLELQNLDICKFNQTGIFALGGFEIFGDNIRMAGTTSISTVGIQQYTSDCHYTNIVTKNVATAIHNVGGANYYTRIHTWNTDSGIVPVSVMFDVENSLHVEDSYADTVATAFKVHDNYPIFVEGMSILHGGSGTGGYMTPAIMGNVVATVFDVPSVLAAQNIRSFNMDYLSPTETYRLFSVDPGTSPFDFDWETNNGARIQSMQHVPVTITNTELDGELSSLKSALVNQNVDGAINNQRFLDESNVHVGGIAGDFSYNTSNLWRAYTSPITVFSGCTIKSTGTVTFVVFRSDASGVIYEREDSTVNYVQSYTCTNSDHYLVLLIQVGSAEQITDANLTKIYMAFTRDVALIPDVYDEMMNIEASDKLFLDGIIHVGGIGAGYVINTGNLYRAYTDPIKVYAGATFKTNSESYGLYVYKYDTSTSKIVRELTSSWVTEYVANESDDYIVLIVREYPDAVVNIFNMAKAITMTKMQDYSNTMVQRLTLPSDLNNATIPGYYGLVYADTYTNCPVAANNRRLLEVVTNNTADTNQYTVVWQTLWLIKDWNTSDYAVYRRERYGGSWSAWIMVYDTAVITGIQNDLQYYHEGANETVLTEVTNTYTAPESGDGVALKVMAYNLAKYKNDTSPEVYIDAVSGKLTNLKKLLYTEAPDIVLTAEDQPDINGVSPETPKNAAQYIWNRMFASTTIDNDHPTFGTAIHSRYTITGDGSATFGTYAGRYGYISIGDKTIFLIAAHLPADTRANRQAALADIWSLTQLATYDYLIIGGDFNTLTDDDRDDLVDWCDEHGLNRANGDFIGWVNTCNVNKAIDNIVTSSNVTIRGFRSLGNWYRDLYSDHYPVVAELVLS